MSNLALNMFLFSEAVSFLFLKLDEGRIDRNVMSVTMKMVTINSLNILSDKNSETSSKKF